MREWQVGDPIGDGNDIGVPDTGYMGYLRDDEDTESENVDDFKSFINLAKSNYNSKNYDRAFSQLNIAYGAYKHMSDFEKTQIKEMPFHRYWIVDLCCMIINRHGRYYAEATDIIVDNLIPVNICLDCDCLYPIDYDCCTQCGKELIKPYEKSIEDVAKEIPDAVRNLIFDESVIPQLVERSVILMKSNDCRLVRVERGIHWDTNFIFEKENKYFKTIYTCEYNPFYDGALTFEEFGVTHNHDRLLSDESFKELIKDTEKKTGFTFKECVGGYGYQLDDNGYDFVFNDEIRLRVCFDMDDDKIAAYYIDLDEMKLSDEYVIY